MAFILCVFSVLCFQLSFLPFTYLRCSFLFFVLFIYMRLGHRFYYGNIHILPTSLICSPSIPFFYLFSLQVLYYFSSFLFHLRASILALGTFSSHAFSFLCSQLLSLSFIYFYRNSDICSFFNYFQMNFWGCWSIFLRVLFSYPFRYTYSFFLTIPYYL